MGVSYSFLPTCDPTYQHIVWIQHSDSTQRCDARHSDYGEAWKEMRVSSLTDLILQKIFRIKQIEDNEGKTLISEGIDANYHDIINYSVFALIHLEYFK